MLDILGGREQCERSRLGEVAKFAERVGGDRIF